MFVITVLLVVCAVVFSQLDQLLIAIGIDAEASRIAAHYTFCILPGLWSFSMFVAISRFLSCQFHFVAPVYILTLTVVLQVTLCHIFVDKHDMEVNGVILSTNITYFLDYIVIVCYCLFEKSVSEYFPSLQMLDVHVFNNLCAFLALTLPSASMLVLRLCALEILVFISGWRSEAELDACIIALSILAITLNPAYALAIVYQQFANYLFGRGRVDDAKSLSYIAYVNSAFELSVLVGLILALHELLINLFTQVEPTLEVLSTVIYLVAILCGIEGFQSVQLGIIRSLGLQGVGTVLNLIAYYLISIPIGVVRCYGLGAAEEHGIKGLFEGVIFGVSCLVITLFTVMECTDFKE